MEGSLSDVNESVEELLAARQYTLALRVMKEDGQLIKFNECKRYVRQPESFINVILLSVKNPKEDARTFSYEKADKKSYTKYDRLFLFR